MGIESLVSEDSRAPLYRLRRHQMQQLLKGHGVTFTFDAPLTALVKIAEGNEIDPTKPLPNGDSLMRPVVVRGEKGVHIEHYPIEKDHATKNANIDYEEIIERNAKISEERDNANAENEDLKKRLAELEGKLSQMEGSSPEDMPMGQLRAYAKSKGVSFTAVMTKAMILEKLAALENPA